MLFSGDHESFTFTPATSARSAYEHASRLCTKRQTFSQWAEQRTRVGRDGNELVAIIERQTERARAPSQWDGTERKRHRFFYSYCMYVCVCMYSIHTKHSTTVYSHMIRMGGRGSPTTNAHLNINFDTETYSSMIPVHPWDSFGGRIVCDTWYHSRAENIPHYRQANCGSHHTMA